MTIETPRRRRAAVGALRRALGKMNDTGAHWLKGRLHGKVRRDGKWELAHCSVGGIEAATSGSVQNVALIALAETIKPAQMRRARESAAVRDRNPITWGKDAGDRHLVETARGIIFRWNDAKGRRWPDVDKAFTKAADRLEAE